MAASATRRTTRRSTRIPTRSYSIREPNERLRGAQWTTDNILPSERFDLWKGVVRETIDNVGADCMVQEKFQARLIGRSFGPLRVAWLHSSQHRVFRTMRHIRQVENPSYIISVQLTGKTSILQGDTSFDLDAGEIAVVNSYRPFELSFSKDVERLVIVLPCLTLESRIPWLKRQNTFKILKDAPYCDLARGHIRELAFRKDNREIEASLLTENVCNLLALSTRSVATSAIGGDEQINLILSFCRNNITNPKLSPGLVAAYFGISLRTLHGRFKSFGQTFGDWVLERRLEACRRALHDPNQSQLTISEIVYRSGFNDLSHFCHIFRNRYNQTASQWRSQTQGLPENDFRAVEEGSAHRI